MQLLFSKKSENNKNFHLIDIISRRPVIKLSSYLCPFY